MKKKLKEELRSRGDYFCRTVADLFECEALYSNRHSTVIRGRPLVPVETLTELANARLNPDGFVVTCEGTDDKYTLCLTSGAVKRGFPWLNIILFAATVLSVLFTAARFSAGKELYKDWSLIREGIPFTAWLMAILVFHEFGHYIFSRLRKIDVSLPYFIPAPYPFILGTLGAVIKSRSPMRNRRDLLDVGAAGPIAGFVVAVAALSVGLARSELVELGEASGLALGNSLMLYLLSAIFVGPIPEGMTISLHPIAFAGWAGLLVTMLNLIPVGSLDGGHVAYALFGRKQRRMAYVAIVGLLVLSIWWMGWLLWAMLAIFIMGPAHPPTLFDEIPLGPRRRLVGYLCFIIFLLCFIPVPFLEAG